MWKYTKGSEKDFEGAPAWAKEKVDTDKGCNGGSCFLAWVGKDKAQVSGQNVQFFDGNYGYRNYIVASREWIEEKEPV